MSITQYQVSLGVKKKKKKQVKKILSCCIWQRRGNTPRIAQTLFLFCTQGSILTKLGEPHTVYRGLNLVCLFVRKVTYPWVIFPASKVVIL